MADQTKAELPYKLGLGDCLERMRDIPDRSIDMVLCDLPYGLTACKWDAIIPFHELWAQYKRVCRQNAAIVLTATQPFTSALIMSNPAWFRAIWYWRKERGTNFVQAKRYPMKVVEECVLFCEGAPLYQPAMKKVKPYRHVLPLPKVHSTQHMNSKSTNAKGERIVKDYSETYPVNILDVARDNMAAGKSLHPTQKPVALMEYLVLTHSKSGDTVLDNTMGSGSTGVACLRTDRRFIGIEKDPNFFSVAQSRIEKAHQDKLAELF